MWWKGVTFAAVRAFFVNNGASANTSTDINLAHDDRFIPLPCHNEN